MNSLKSVLVEAYWRLRSLGLTSIALWSLSIAGLPSVASLHGQEPAVVQFVPQQERLTQHTFGATQGEPDSLGDLPTEELLPQSGVRGANASVIGKPISQLTVDTSPPQGKLPTDLAKKAFARQPTYYAISGEHAAPLTFSYRNEALGFCHPPVYFEQVKMERYGIAPSHGATLLSAAHFFGTLPALPYKMTMVPPCEQICTFGRRCGLGTASCRHQKKRRTMAAVAQASVVTGLILAFP